MPPTGLFPRGGPRPTSSRGEKDLYQALAEHLPPTWTAWHSLRLRAQNTWEGEGDFVLAIPERGVLILEVKGGAIDQRDGQWFQNNRRMDHAPRGRLRAQAKTRLLDGMPSVSAVDSVRDRNVSSATMRQSSVAVIAAVICVPLACAPPSRVDAPTASAPRVVEAQLAPAGASRALVRITTDIADEEAPSLSPDGKTLLFHQSTWNGAAVATRAIVGVDPASGARRTLYTGSNSLSGSPFWLPDGSTFVFASRASGAWSIVKALSSSPGSGMTIIVPSSSALNPDFPSVSPDGKRVAFEFDPGEGNQIAVIGVDGSQLTLLGPGEHPRFSPDGTRVVFARSANSGSRQIYTLDSTTGGNLVQLTSDELASNWPSFSSDGRFVVFARSARATPDCLQDDCTNLFLVRLDGTGATQLTQGNESVTLPTWGSDGWIYFSAGRRVGLGWNHDLWRINAADLK